MMRKPRDFDSELKALSDKARQLKERRLHQLGELVIATGADALPVEQLAGALLSAADNNDAAAKEAWRKRGAAFFQQSRSVGGGARGDKGSASSSDGGASPARSASSAS